MTAPAQPGVTPSKKAVMLGGVGDEFLGSNGTAQAGKCWMRSSAKRFSRVACYGR